MITTKQIRSKVKLLDDLILKYKEQSPQKERDWQTYEEKLFVRIKHAIHFFEDYISRGVCLLKTKNCNKVGRPEKLSLEQKVRILLLQRLIERSNREMSFMLLLFSSLNQIDISYKTIERIYDDEKVFLVLNNIHYFILQDKNVKDVDVCGDATGYVLSVKEHYASIASKIKDKKSTKKRKILFSFALMDLKSRLYLAYGTSFKSEKEAYKQSMLMLKDTKINLNSMRLDRYYSTQSTVKNLFDIYKNIKFYLIPKTNVTIKGSLAWKKMLKNFLENTPNYLSEYFKRNQSESGFSEDKRRFGWRIPQKIDKRVDTAYFGILTWHNLFWVGT